MHDFTPVHAALGGALIAAALAVMLVGTGRIAGLSGVIAGVAHRRDREWHGWFVAGMLAVGVIVFRISPDAFDAHGPRALPVVAISGLLVGAGTRLANGCTSGHGLLGLSRRSPRSLVATAVFFGVAVATATLAHGRLS